MSPKRDTPFFHQPEKLNKGTPGNRTTWSKAGEEERVPHAQGREQVSLTLQPTDPPNGHFSGHRLSQPQRSTNAPDAQTPPAALRPVVRPPVTYILESLEAAPPVTLATRSWDSSTFKSSSCLSSSSFFLPRRSRALILACVQGRVWVKRRVPPSPPPPLTDASTGPSRPSTCVLASPRRARARRRVSEAQVGYEAGPLLPRRRREDGGRRQRARAAPSPGRQGCEEGRQWRS